jgi:hypothetical protein
VPVVLMNTTDEARIFREEFAETRRNFLRFADAQHRLALDCKWRGDQAGMNERCALREAYRGAARDISDTLARVTRRMRKETPNR